MFEYVSWTIVWKILFQQNFRVQTLRNIVKSIHSEESVQNLISYFYLYQYKFFSIHININYIGYGYISYGVNFKSFSVIFLYALENYWENLKITSLKIPTRINQPSENLFFLKSYSISFTRNVQVHHCKINSYPVPLRI